MISVNDRPPALEAFMSAGTYMGQFWGHSYIPVSSGPSHTLLPLSNAFIDGSDFSWSHSDPTRVYFNRARSMRIRALGRVVYNKDVASGGNTGLFQLGIYFSRWGGSSPIMYNTLPWEDQTITVMHLYDMNPGEYLSIATSQETGVGMKVGIANLMVWSTGFSPNEVTAGAPTELSGLTLWLQPSSLSGLSIDDPVETWPDDSGNGNNLSEATLANRPLWKGNRVQFDGSDDRLTTSSVFLNGSTGSVFIVVQPELFVGFGGWALSSSDMAPSSPQGLLGFLVHTNAARIWQESAGTVDDVLGNTTMQAGFRYVLEWHSDGATYTIKRNGTTLTKTFNSGSDTGDWFAESPSRNNVSVGALIREGAPQAFFNGSIYEVMVYDGVTLSDGDRRSVGQYLADKYGITYA